MRTPRNKCENVAGGCLLILGFLVWTFYVPTGLPPYTHMNIYLITMLLAIGYLNYKTSD